jgi:hypothetical protein
VVYFIQNYDFQHNLEDTGKQYELRLLKGNLKVWNSSDQLIFHKPITGMYPQAIQGLAGKVINPGVNDNYRDGVPEFRDGLDNLFQFAILFEIQIPK